MRTHPFIATIERTRFAPSFGYVRKVAPGVVEASGPAMGLGDLCAIETDIEGRVQVLAEVSAADQNGITLVPLEPHAQIRLDARVVAQSSGNDIAVGDCFAGRAVDPFGRPIDGCGPVQAREYSKPLGQVPKPMERANPGRIIHTGIRAIDGILPLARGQRIGIFAASGVGKTTLMEQLALQMECSRCVICLVGERGREVEAVWSNLAGRHDLQRFTLVAATSDESAALRARSVDFALSLAEHWRAKGEHVVLIVDSVTRLAMALREIGLAAGAPPTVRAYPPNVFSALPRIVERCGAIASGGSISAVMTVLSETDDVDDPIVELMKSLLDGHIILSRTLAEQGHFPAIDVPRSISRGAERLVSPDQARAMRETVALLGAYEETRVMIESGVYRSGTNIAVDRAIAVRPELMAFLRQPAGEAASPSEAIARLRSIIEKAAGHA